MDVYKPNIEDYKLEDFKTDNPGREFPAYRTLSGSERRRLDEGTRELLGYPELELSDRIWRTINTQGYLVPNVNWFTPEFNLKAVLVSLLDAQPSFVYFACTRANGPPVIDEMAPDDLSKWLDYIFYPCEDMIVFDDTLSWYMNIWHEGAVGFFRREAVHDAAKIPPA